MIPVHVSGIPASRQCRTAAGLLAMLLAILPISALALSSTTLVTLTQTAVNDRFGYSVSGAGDLDGDGYSDVIVGAYLHDNVAPDDGAAYVYFGSSTPNASPDITLRGSPTLSEVFGYSVSSGGDVNHDGYPDLIVGAPGDNAGGSGAGRAFVFFGGPFMDDVADWTLTGAAGDGFGASVSSAGDVNGDGYADVIVGAPYSNA